MGENEVAVNEHGGIEGRCSYMLCRMQSVE